MEGRNYNSEEISRVDTPLLCK